MRKPLFYFFPVIIFVACNNHNSPSTIDTSSNKAKNIDSNLNVPFQHPDTREKVDSVTATNIPSLEKVFNEDPSQENAFELAYAYAEAKNKKALSFTDSLLKYVRKENVGFAWYIKGIYYENTGDVNQALGFYDSSIVADYTFLDTYRDKGQLQYKLKQYNAALKTFAQGQSLSHDPSAKAEFLYWVAKAFEALGDKRSAKDNYEKAYVTDKTLTEAKIAADKLK